MIEAVRSDNVGLWDRYEVHRRSLTALHTEPHRWENAVQPMTCGKAPILEARVCRKVAQNNAGACILLHGSNPTSGMSILQTGLTTALVGENRICSAPPMFGPGIYLTECSSKADEYSHDGPNFDGVYAVLVCRAVIGEPFVTTTPGDFSDRVMSGEYDSVLGDHLEAVGTYREFVFFHEAAIYPEYLVKYRRVYEVDDGVANGEGAQVAAPSASVESGRQGAGDLEVVSKHVHFQDWLDDEYW